jgi:integrase
MLEVAAVASIETRRSKDGKATTYRVKWRTGGGRSGDWDGRTLDSLGEAKILKSLVDAYEQQWPPADVLIGRGLGFLVEGPVPQPQAAPVAEPPAVVTFGEYAVLYVDGLVKPNPETKRKYLERLRVHVFPVIGDRPIAEITRGEMRRWQQGLIGRLSAKTIQNIRGETVSPIFEAACLPGEDGEPPLRADNPLKGLQLPERVKPRREIVEDPREAKLVIEAAYEIDPNAAELLLVLLATGMRWGEIAGLPVRAINRGRGTVSIMQVLRRQCYQWIVVPAPKTPDGFREIPVPPQIMEVLVRRCEGRGRDAFVFTAPRGGPWRHDDFWEGRWKKVRDLAMKKGLSKVITMYGLRHSLLTWLASEDVDIATLQRIAGHKRAGTTFDVYVHGTRKHHGKVKEAVTGLVGAESAFPSGQAYPA